MRFRYFDPLQQSTVEGDLTAGAEVAELVSLVTQLRSECVPALELVGRDGCSLVLGVSRDRAVVLWTAADGTTSHSVGAPQDERVVFDYFGAFTQVPGHYTVPLPVALDAAGGFVDGYLDGRGEDRRDGAGAGSGRPAGTPSLPLVVD